MANQLGMGNPIAAGAAAPSGPGYNAWLDPRNGDTSAAGGLGRLIGGIMGRPTAAQAGMGALGKAQAAISAGIQSGKPPNQAMLDFVQGPDGPDFFAHATMDDYNALKEFIQAQSPTMQAPGTMAVDPSGMAVPGSGVPTETMQTAQGLIQGALGGGPQLGNDPEAQRDFYQLVMSGKYTTPNNNTETERALGRLAAKGFVSPDLADLANSPLLVKTPLRNANGDTIGVGLSVIGHPEMSESHYFNTGQLGVGIPSDMNAGQGLDPGQPSPGQMPPDTGIAPQGMSMPGEVMPGSPTNDQGLAPQIGGGIAPPGQNNAPPVNREPGSGYFGVTDGDVPDASAIHATGLAQGIKRWGGGLWGQMFTSFTGADAAAQEQAINQIKSDGSGLAGSTRLAYFAKLYESLITPSLWTNEPQFARQLKGYRQALESKAGFFATHMYDQSIDPKLRVGYQEDYYNIEAALMHVPPTPVLDEIISQLNASDTGAMGEMLNKAGRYWKQGEADVSGTVKKLDESLGLGGQSGGNTPQGPSHEFNSVEEAAKAVIEMKRANTIHPGDQITIKGKPYTVD